MTSHQVIAALVAAGFEVTEGSRHTKLRHADGRITVIPRHARELPKGTLHAIERESGVKLV